MKISITPSKLKILIGVLAGIVVLSGFVTWIAYRVYTVRDGSPMIRGVASWVPAARVGADTIRYGKFLDSREVLKTYLESDAAKQAGVAQSLDVDAEKRSYERLLQLSAIEELAKNKGVVVTDADVRASFAEQAALSSSTIPNVAEYLSKNFHWTEEDFRANIVYPALLEERVAATFSSSTQDQVTMLESYLNDRLLKPDVKRYLKF